LGNELIPASDDPLQILQLGGIVREEVNWSEEGNLKEAKEEKSSRNWNYQEGGEMLFDKQKEKKKKTQHPHRPVGWSAGPKFSQIAQRDWNIFSPLFAPHLSTIHRVPPFSFVCLPKFIHRFLRLRMISFQSMYRKKEQQI
jgi:hypothetical protein